MTTAGAPGEKVTICREGRGPRPSFSRVPGRGGGPFLGRGCLRRAGLAWSGGARRGRARREVLAAAQGGALVAGQRLVLAAAAGREELVPVPCALAPGEAAEHQQDA